MEVTDSPEELHENGEPHLHSLIQFEGRYQCTNYRFFDLISPTSSTHFHPNIQNVKSSSDVKAYIEKDGDFVDYGEFQIDGRSSRGVKHDLGDVYAEALNSSSKTQALQIIKEKDPKTFFVQYHNIFANADKIFAPLPQPYVSFFSSYSFKLPEQLRLWLESELNLDGASAARPIRPKSIIVEGHLRTGKTQWARSLGRHNYLCGHLDFNNKCYSNDIVYNIIDDISPNYLKMKHWKELLGAQQNWQTNCKYGKPVLIKGGIPSIILCNPGPESSYHDFLEKPENSALKDWTLLNCEFVFLKGPLY
ncbi:hypothetical protein SESBI_49107 [Sesbania bispinosa]|nr:hypothetical protein SESBI_49107 [Sesbania bispinosa]